MLVVRRRTAIAVAVAGAVAGAWALLAASVRAPAAPVLDVPFRFDTGQPIVAVSVGGGDALPFVVDTGASVHLVDAPVAVAAGAGDGRAGRLLGGGEGAASVRWVDRLTLGFGGATWKGQRAAIADLGYPGRKPFAGLVGAPILSRYAVQFDFPARRLRLFDPASFSAPAGAAIVPFELHEGLPVVAVTIDAGVGPVVARLMVDTGAGTFVDLNRPFVDAHRLVEAVADAAPADRPAALGGTAPFLYGTGRRVAIASEVFERPRLGLSRAESGSSARRERDGIVGTELLQRFVPTVDYSRRQLVLVRETSPSVP